CRKHSITPPRRAIGIPRVVEAIATQISTNLRQRRRHLHPAVRQHQQRRRRALEACTEAGADLERLEAELHLACESARRAREQAVELAPLALARLEPVPESSRSADAHH